MLTELKGRFVGSITGVAAGDAAGMPYEGLRHDQINANRLIRGRITDDTQLTLIVADVLSRTQGQLFDRELFAKRLVDWLTKAVNPGKACLVAARRLRDGAAWGESGVASAGCGAAMRAIPIGLRYFHSVPRLVRAAMNSAMVTHTDRRAVAGAIAVAAGSAWSLRFARSKSVSSQHMLRFVARACEPTCSEMAELILSCGDVEPKNVAGTAMEVVPAAFYWFLNYPDHFSRAVSAAVAGGGDTDSVAAITGGLVGARIGINGMGSKRLLPEFAQAEYVGTRLFCCATKDVISLLRKGATKGKTSKSAPQRERE